MAAIEVERADAEVVELHFAGVQEELSQADLLYKLVHEYDARIMARNMSAHSCLYNLNVQDIPLLLYYTEKKDNRLAGRGPGARLLLEKIAAEFLGAELKIASSDT